MSESVRPVGGKVAGFFIEVLEGRDHASLAQLRAWRDEVRRKLDILNPEAKIATVGAMPLDGFASQVRDHYVTAIRQIEAIATDLEHRIQAQEAGG